jgi:hypothetical protein
MKRQYLSYLLPAVIGLALLAAGCGSTVVKPKGKVSSNNSLGTSATSQPQNAVRQESAVAPENNPPGDIPDSQVFVIYKPPSGKFEVKVPEGWALSTSESGVDFTDKLNTVSLKWVPSTSEPTLERANSVEAQELARTEPAFQLVETKQVTLPGGQAILIKYQKNSATNQVTGKKYRMDVLRYEFYRNGLQANLTLESPVGADNVDPWRIISESFKWL